MAEGPLSIKVVKGQIEDIEAKLHRAARGDAMRGIRKAITRETLASRKRIRAAALGTLPHKGGLNKWAAVLPSVIVRSEKTALSVKIRMQRGHHDFKSLDAGRIRHPLFGKRKKGDWFNQTIPSGFFTKEIDMMGPQLREAVSQAIKDYAAQFNKPGA